MEKRKKKNGGNRSSLPLSFSKKNEKRYKKGMNTMIISQETADVKGKNVEKWQEKKTAAKRIAKRLHLIGEHGRAYRMEQCSEEVVMMVCDNCGRTHVINADLCRDRVCPVCNWRLAMQRFAKMTKIVDEIEKQGEWVYSFVTLTIKNVPVERLRGTIEMMSAAWNRLRVRKEFRQMQLGWARAVEITYNDKARTFHPHYHAIICHDSSQKINENTMRQTFCRLWKDVCRLDYYPQVDYRLIHNIDRGCGLQKGILECFKYINKSSDLEKMPLPTFARYIKEIQGLRFLSFGGIFKEVKALLGLQLEDLEEYKERDIRCESCGKEMQEVLLKWSENSLKYSVFERKNA